MLRVVQWATGNVGREAVAAVHAHRALALVGALVYDESKAGRDVGEICGIGPIGVTAATDREAVLDIDADCALYMAQGEMDPAGAIDDICALLASGKSVVSTALTALIYPRSAGEEVVGKLEHACSTDELSRLMLGAINRDPRIFDQPDELRLDRSNQYEHVAFSKGIHSCLGQQLARSEMRVTIERLFDRTAGIWLSADHHGHAGEHRFTYDPTCLFRGHNKLHLEFASIN